MDRFDFNWKFKDFEIRVAHTYGKEEKPYIDLIKHYRDDNGRDFAFTLAYWHEDKDGNYELRFVGERPLEYIADIDIVVIWKQLYLAQAMFEDARRKSDDGLD